MPEQILTSDISATDLVIYFLGAIALLWSLAYADNKWNIFIIIENTVVRILILVTILILFGWGFNLLPSDKPAEKSCYVFTDNLSEINDDLSQCKDGKVMTIYGRWKHDAVRQRCRFDREIISTQDSDGETILLCIAK